MPSSRFIQVQLFLLLMWGGLIFCQEEDSNQELRNRILDILEGNSSDALDFLRETFRNNEESTTMTATTFEQTTNIVSSTEPTSTTSSEQTSASSMSSSTTTTTTTTTPQPFNLDDLILPSATRHLNNGSAIVFGYYANLLRRLVESPESKIYMYGTYVQLATPLVILISASIIAIAIGCCLCNFRVPTINIRWHHQDRQDRQHHRAEEASRVDEATPLRQEEQAPPPTVSAHQSVDEVDRIPPLPDSRTLEWARYQRERMERRHATDISLRESLAKLGELRRAPPPPLPVESIELASMGEKEKEEKKKDEASAVDADDVKK